MADCVVIRRHGVLKGSEGGGADLALPVRSSSWAEGAEETGMVLQRRPWAKKCPCWGQALIDLVERALRDAGSGGVGCYVELLRR